MTLRYRRHGIEQDAPDPPGLAGPTAYQRKVPTAPAAGDLIGVWSPARRGCRHCVLVAAEHIGAAAHLCGVDCLRWCIRSARGMEQLWPRRYRFGLSMTLMAVRLTVLSASGWTARSMRSN